MPGCIHTSELAQEGKLQVTNGYYLEFGEFTRILNYLRQYPERKRFGREEISVATGLPKRHVQSLASITASMNLTTTQTYRLTELGRLIAENDTFFDDLGTLWLCHYLLASNMENIVWNHMANCVLPSGVRVTSSDARKTMLPFLLGFSKRTTGKKLLQEIRSFFNAYAKQRFRDLHYLREGSGAYYLRYSSTPVPPLTLMCTLITYRDRFSPGASGLEIGPVCSADNSPGRLLNLREAQVRELLDQLHRTDLLTIEARADLDQVRFGQELTVTEVLSRYYRER